MGVLSWGKCEIEHSVSTDGVPSATWDAFDTPKEGTTKLAPTAGAVKEAIEEGGDIIDSRTGKTKYTFEFDLFVKKGKTLPLEDEDGVITGEHAFRLTPEDPSCDGILIERCTIAAQLNYSTADGKVVHYVAQCLKPKTGKTVKAYTKVTTNPG